MKIISYNVNGIRASIKKGFIDWLATNPADIICLQEIKAEKENVEVESIEKLGYKTYWFSAQKKGYSGVAIFTKLNPTGVFYGNGIEQNDFEGRIIRADFEKNISLINAYFPSGTSGNERQTYKYQWLNEFENYLKDLSKKRKLIVVGDYNIAHTEIDIHDPKGNKKSSGFLPEEREWMTNFLKDKLIDTYRYKNPETTGGYSWWSQRFPTVRLQNKGWRIDYICVSESLKNNIIDASIYPNIKHSDHCPIFVSLDI